MTTSDESSIGTANVAVTKNRRMQRIAKHLDRDSVLEMAAFTIINVHDLRSASNALLEREHYGQARSLGIMALEELGKFVATVNYLAGNSNTLDFVNSTWNHKSKQRSGYVIALLSTLLVKLQIPGRLESEEQSLESFFTKLTSRITENIDQLSIELERQVPKLERLVKETGNGEIEYQRQDGFYVSLAIDELNRISTKHPRLVTREEAVFIIKLLSVLDDNTVDSMLDPIATNYFNGIDSSNELNPAAISALKKMIDDSTHQIRVLSDSSREPEAEKKGDRGA